MLINYYSFRMPSSLLYNDENMLIYYIKKYGFDNLLPIPVCKVVKSTYYIVVFPEKIFDEFIKIMTDEEKCEIKLIKSEEILYDNFENTYVSEMNDWYNNRRNIDYFIYKK